MANKIKSRRGTAAAWTSANPVLLEGEIGIETDTRRMKVGDGVTAWNSLAYFRDDSVDVADIDTSGLTAGNPLIVDGSNGVTEGSFGAGAGEFAEGDHVHTFGTTAGTYAEGDKLPAQTLESGDPNSVTITGIQDPDVGESLTIQPAEPVNGNLAWQSVVGGRTWILANASGMGWDLTGGDDYSSGTPSGASSPIGLTLADPVVGSGAATVNGVVGRYTGDLCRVGSSLPYTWYRWNGTTWEVDTSVTSSNITAALGYTPVDPGDLGNSSGLDVGTTAGTVAAGDHTHTSADISDSKSGGNNSDAGKIVEYGTNGSITTLGNLSNIKTAGGGYIESTGGFRFNNASHVTTLSQGSPSSSRTITFPDATGTVALTSQLGSAASLDVGTTAGTVAAGDHTHTNAQIVTAIEESPSNAREALGLGVTITAPDGTITLSPPVGSFVAGDKQTYFITPSGNQNFHVDSIAVPSDSALTLPKTLTGSSTYIVQITYSGSFWMLTSLVGGYATP